MVSIAEVIEDTSEDRLDAIREGFAALVRMRPEHRDEVFRLVSTGMSSGAASIDLEPLGDASGLSTGLLSRAVNAITGIIYLSSEGEFRVEDFVRAATGKLFADTEAPIATSIIGRVLKDTAHWRSSVARRRLAVETMPAFLALDLSVDLRLRFAKNQISDAAPVLVVHLDTDTNGKEIWFQATRGDVQHIIERLTRAAQQLEQAEQLYTEASSSKGQS